MKLFLLGLGVLLELVGLALVVVENREIEHVFGRREGRAFVRQARANLRAHGAVVTVTGEPPTTEQRVEKLEAAVARLGEDLARGIDQLREEMREERAADLTQIQQELNAEIGEVRRLLNATVAPTRRRWLGIGAFGVGLVLQTAANLLP